MPGEGRVGADGPLLVCINSGFVSSSGCLASPPSRYAVLGFIPFSNCRSSSLHMALAINITKERPQSSTIYLYELISWASMNRNFPHSWL